MSSDSDDDVIKAKKPKSTGVRARRGFSRKLDSSAGAVSTTSVSECFSSAVSAKMVENVKNALSKVNNDDVEDNILTLNEPKPTAAELKKYDTLILSDDDEVNENSQNIQNTPNNKNYNSNNNIANTILSPSPPPPPRPPSPPPDLSQKSRNRRGGKQKKTLLSAANAYTKSLSDAQKELKSGLDICSPEPEVLILDEEDVVTVRVDVKGNIKRFTLGATDSFTPIITQLAAHQNVTVDHVMLLYRDRSIRPTDSPFSIKLHTADIIKCLIVTEDQCSLDESYESADDLIELVLQTQGKRHKELIKTPRDRPLLLLMKEYAKRSGKELNLIQFYFDGDLIQHLNTPESLDMDDGDCIDVTHQQVTVIS